MSDLRPTKSGVPKGPVLVNDLSDVPVGKVLPFAGDAKIVTLPSDFQNPVPKSSSGLELVRSLGTPTQCR